MGGGEYQPTIDINNISVSKNVRRNLIDYGHSGYVLPHEQYLEFGGIAEAKILRLFLTYYEPDFPYQLTTVQV